MANPTSIGDNGAAALVQIAQVQGQLQAIMTLLDTHHRATQQRIDDMRASTERRIDDMRTSNDQRLDGVDQRLATLEQNERTTAIKTGSIAALAGAVSSALVTAGIQALKLGGKG